MSISLDVIVVVLAICWSHFQAWEKTIILCQKIYEMAFLLVSVSGNTFFRYVSLFVDTVIIVLSDDTEYKRPELLDRLETRIETQFEHTGCKKIYNFLTIFHVWGKETWSEVMTEFMLFIPDTYVILVGCYICYNIVCLYCGNWRLVSRLSVLLHLVFVFCMICILFCSHKKTLGALEDIMKRVKEPLLGIRETATCIEAFLGKW